VRTIGKAIATGGKGDAVDPSTCGGGEFGANGVEGKAGSPYRWIGTFIDVFDECTENTGLATSKSPSCQLTKKDGKKECIKKECQVSYLGIGTPSSKKNIVRMPINTQHSTPNRLLQMLANPPIALFVKGAHTDCAGTGATGKLVFIWGPADEGCCSVETKENECGFPGPVGLSLPDVCIALRDTLVSTWLWGSWAIRLANR
jgi:hypothetical protein